MECGEFHDLGDFYGSISTVDEAIAIWKQIPPERMHGIPAIGIYIHTPGTELIDDVGIDILSGRRFDLDILEYIPDIKDNPKAMEVIAELMVKAIPLISDMEIDGVMSEEMEAQVWEKQMPDLMPTEQFAVELDRFIYTHDTDLYRGNVPNMTEAVAEITEALKQRDTRDIAWWLADISDSGKEPEESKRALELLGKLAEYKPLAKIEEMEEQNYNMVDGVLNNGAGEKVQKEENRREQEHPAARTSLKARLAEKKAQAAGQGHEENKKISRGRCKDMDTRFTVEESNLICIFAGEGRNEVIKDMERALPHLEDTDMVELSGKVIGKRGMTDEEFAQLELTEAE